MSLRCRTSSALYTGIHLPVASSSRPFSRAVTTSLRYWSFFFICFILFLFSIHNLLSTWLTVPFLSSQPLPPFLPGHHPAHCSLTSDAAYHVEEDSAVFGGHPPESVWIAAHALCRQAAQYTFQSSGSHGGHAGVSQGGNAASGDTTGTLYCWVMLSCPTGVWLYVAHMILGYILLIYLTALFLTPSRTV